MTGATEGAHMGHPDFRAYGRIFATLHPDHRSGMVTLTPEQQRHYVKNARKAFQPENGAWGLQGCTAVRLDAVDEETLGEALTLAWRRSREKPKPRPRTRGGARTTEKEYHPTVHRARCERRNG